METVRRWPAFWVCATVAALTILDLTKVNVALPSIEQAFDAGSTELQLVVSGYVLAMGLLLVPMGRIGDQRSRRTMIVIGLSLFTVASAVCALAPNAEVLLVGRLLQGVAAGVHMPQVMGLIQQLFQGRERGRAFGMFGATIGLATAFGPLIGGLSIAIGGAEEGWRGIFWMNVPVCAAVIVLALRLIPGSAGSGRRLELDPVGTVLFGGAVIALMFPFLFTTGSPDDPPARWWALAALGLLLVAFVLWERRYEAGGRAPLLPIRLFALPSFRNGALVGTAYFAGLPAMFVLTTLFLQIGVHLAALDAALVTIGFALSSAVTAWLSGRLVARYGRGLVVLGTVVMLMGIGGLVLAALFAPAEIVGYVMAAIMVFSGLGGGLVVSPNQTLMFAEVPVQQAGLAGSVGQLGQRVGSAIGIPIALSFFYSTIYRESGTRLEIVVYQDAFAFGMIAVGGFTLVALLAALADLVHRRRPPARDAA
ncbi:MFS transporter [Microbacterium album]|uniref:MFS transporter n=1 Tax=Microbacterium album TaxID=2053191 RepID=A0A917ICG1_9MICO|nr:MFS transporter [Microbacterium album]GGH34752.1 MFS transporter [Microbacterium album]